MRDYEKCIYCDCYNADYGEAERNGQIVDACALCEMSEDESQAMAEWYARHDERKGNEADDLSGGGNDKW